MVRIIADTTSCLDREVAEKYQIPVIPQVINFGEESFYEGKDMDIEAFMRRLRTNKVIPKTAAPPPELFVEEFKRLVPSGDTILCIHPSAEVSGTVRSAEVARLDFPGADIRVIDTRTVGSPLGTMVELAAEWAAQGQSADEIVNHLFSMIARCRVYFLVATLDYLARGGRIGGASALMGSILQIKPILYLKDGHVDVFEKERTHKRAIQRLIAITANQMKQHDKGYLTIMHAGVPEQGEELAQELSKIVHQPQVKVFNVPPAIVTHGGPGILATAFFEPL